LPQVTIILVLAIVFAVVFDYINGFHDAANAIATVVSTRVLSPRAAILMSAVLNFVGALTSTSVAKTVASGLVNPHESTQPVILAAIIGAIVWNLVTWYFGIPSSSSHALIGGIVGAAVAKGGFHIVLWNGLMDKVVIPLVSSPIAGFIGGFVLMKILYMIFARSTPAKVNHWFRRLQIVSSLLMAYSHGSNDAQKSMGVITLALVSVGILSKPVIPLWVILVCAAAMAFGTTAGGWRIIKTMGHRIVRLEPVHGFAAEVTSATVLLTTAHFGMPVSTTHVISSSILGVGSAKRLSAVRWGVAQQMVIAWLLTLPAAGIVAALTYAAFHVIGLK
jgi:inorganic phosphate transporter, PiT family